MSVYVPLQDLDFQRHISSTYGIQCQWFEVIGDPIGGIVKHHGLNFPCVSLSHRSTSRHMCLLGLSILSLSTIFFRILELFRRCGNFFSFSVLLDMLKDGLERFKAQWSCIKKNKIKYTKIEFSLNVILFIKHNQDGSSMLNSV
jgi:hypothetical protein